MSRYTDGACDPRRESLALQRTFRVKWVVFSIGISESEQLSDGKNGDDTLQNLSTRGVRFITPMVIGISKGVKVMSCLGLSELGKTLTIKEVRRRMDRSQWGGMNWNTQPRVSCRWLSTLSHSLWTWWAFNPWMNGRVASTQWLPLYRKRLWVVEMSSFAFLGSPEYNCRTEDKEGD